MKLVRNLAAALLLACALTVNVFGGDMPSPGFVPPPPPIAPATSSECPSDAKTTEDGTVVMETEDDLLVTALMALLSVF